MAGVDSAPGLHGSRKTIVRSLPSGIAVAVALIAAPSASAATINVSNTHDGGVGSLRAAIEKANDEASFPGKDTIKITATGKIRLESALPDLATDMAIVGPGASALTVTRASGAPAFRIFTLPEVVTVSISRLSVRRGALDSSASYGGGIFNYATLTLKSVVVANNSAVASASGDSAFGGGIYNSSPGVLAMRASRVTGNEVTGPAGAYLNGGGIRNEGQLDMVRSTLDGNAGNAALFTGSGTSSATIENSTIAENQAIGLLAAVGSVTLRSSTIAANEGTPGSPWNVYMGEPTTTASFQNTIVADPPPGGSNCELVNSPIVISQGYNLSSDSSCPFGDPTDRLSKDPKLASLAKNDGPTPTMAIPKSSPATDRGDSDGLSSDQRGKKRPVNFAGIANAASGDGADIGAFEIQKP